MIMFLLPMSFSSYYPIICCNVAKLQFILVHYLAQILRYLSWSEKKTNLLSSAKSRSSVNSEGLGRSFM